MGFDFGMARIGVAVGQTITGSASPLTVLTARDGIPDWHQLERLLKAWKPARVIVGLPLNMDGSDSDMSALAEKFGRKLQGRFGVTVEMVDERLSSREARTRVDEGELLDATAAAIILETWLSERGA